METTRILLHPAFSAGPVDPRVFGGFLEHIGRAVYEGVFEPASRHADAEERRSGGSLRMTVEPADGSIASLESAEILAGPDPKAANSFEHPDVVAARKLDEVSARAGKARLKLPPLSMAALTLKLG
jgi:alpha-L-arabinofuranosidase